MPQASYQTQSVEKDGGTEPKRRPLGGSLARRNIRKWRQANLAVAPAKFGNHVAMPRSR
jgi:hypothetical protein